MKTTTFFVSLLSALFFTLPLTVIADDFAGGSGTEEDPYRVETAEHLNNVRDYLSAHFRQVSDIDLSGYMDGSGWDPIGSYDRHPFQGSYDGNGYKIDNLVINQPNNDYIGLFAYIEDSELKDITIENAAISGNNIVGGLVGISKGIIIDSSFTGEVTGELSVGGLLGFNDGGSVTNSHTAGEVSGGGENSSPETGTGGLVGRDQQSHTFTITDSSSSSNVSGEYYVGGLVGRSGNISNSYATGNVTGTNHVGGLSGIGSDISDSYAAGEVTGESKTGGLIGSKDRGTISDSYATGEVTGEDETGGLIGRNIRGTISDSYATGMVSGTSRVGGLAGYSQLGSITDSYATGDVSGTGGVGGLVGSNDATPITRSHAVGNVTCKWGHVGGLIGFNTASITDSYARGSVSGYEDVGGLVGHNTKGNITGSYATGAVTGVKDNVGGLIGINKEPNLNITRVKESYAIGSVSGGENVGGLIGYNNARINANFSSGNVSGEASIGGLVGYNKLLIENCYAGGTVSGDKDVGGLAGINQNNGIIRRSYARGAVTGNEYTGGLVGWNYNVVEHSYYDTQTTGQDDEGKGIPSSTEEMKQQSTFLEWDFDDIWDIIENLTYPYLQWQTSPSEKDYEAAIVSYTIPELYLKRSAEITLTLVNIGANTWEIDSDVYLGAVGDHDDLAPSEYWRVGLEHDVEPAQTHTFNIPVYPEEEGTFTTEWRMLKEGEFWFGEKFIQEVEVTVRTDVEETIWQLFK